MADYAILAQALRYPAPGRARQLADLAPQISHEAVRKPFATFVEHIQQLSLGQWEELHTHTLDLSPAWIPYIGFQMWGESYQRGNFMALLNRQMLDLGVDLDGELPDHLGPVLRYLDVAPRPEPALVDALLPAIQKMSAGLRKADENNPYHHLLAAIQACCARLGEQPASQNQEAHS